MSRPCLAVSLLFLLLPSQAGAGIFDDYNQTENSVDLKTEVGVFSSRVFRGQELYDKPSFQPRLRGQLNYDTYSLYLEGFSHIALSGSDTETSEPNEDPTHFEKGKRFDELDYDLAGAKSFGPAKLHLGHRWYSYSRKTSRLDNSAEFFGKLQLDVVTHPFMEIDYDWDTYKGWYGETGLEQPILLSPQSESVITPFFMISYSAGLADGSRPIYAEDGLVAAVLGCYFDVALSDSFYLEPYGQYSWPIDEATDSIATFGIRAGVRGGIN